MRVVILLLVFLMVSAADIGSTWYLLNNFPNEEAGTIAKNSSLLGIAFSPVTTLFNTAFLLLVFIAEGRSHRFDEYLATSVVKPLIFILPLFYLLLILNSAIGNVLTLSGFRTPLAYLLLPFNILTESSFLQHVMALSLVAFALLYGLVILAQHIYSPASTLTQSSRSTER